jgi:YbbR domain-containing protein
MKRLSAAAEWKNKILENGSYKLVALFVTLILWVTILGRRDFVLSKDMDIEFLLPRTIAVAETNQERRVTVKVSGPRIALKKFAQNPGTITIDLGRQAEPGPIKAVITPRNVEVPFGVKVLSVTPDTINVHLIAAPVGEDGVGVSYGGTAGHPPTPPRGH